MVKCAKCSKVVGKKSPGVQCNKCSKWFHGTCSSLTTEQLTALSTTESVDWKCRACAGGVKPKRISVILPDPEPEEEESEAEMVTHVALSAKDRESIVRDLRSIVREIIRSELQTTLEFYSKKIDDYEERMKEYVIQLKLLENQCKEVKNTCKNLSLKNDVLEQKIGQIEQSRTSNDIEICGVTEIDHQDVSAIAQKVGQLLNQKPEDIVSAHRKPKQPVRSGSVQEERAKVNAPIIVTLRPGCREKWLISAKTCKLVTHDLGLNSDAEVYLRESLTPTTSYLLWKAKSDLKKSQLCEYIWCKNGVIMARKKEGDKKIFYIRSVKDIERIAKELQVKK